MLHYHSKQSTILHFTCTCIYRVLLFIEWIWQHLIVTKEMIETYHIQLLCTTVLLHNNTTVYQVCLYKFEI